MGSRQRLLHANAQCGEVADNASFVLVASKLRFSIDVVYTVVSPEKLFPMQ
jgi:hypothetical protein